MFCTEQMLFGVCCNVARDTAEVTRIMLNIFRMQFTLHALHLHDRKCKENDGLRRVRKKKTLHNLEVTNCDLLVNVL